MRTVRDFDFSGKTVLLRADLDEPLEDGTVDDDFRLRKAVPTIRHILGKAEQLIIIGHQDRPGGDHDPEHSLRPIANRLAALLERDISFVSNFSIPDDEIVMLENLRFHPGERANDEQFAQRLADLADIYVNEAFAVSHRNHASIVGIPQLIPGCIGLQFEKELRHLSIDNAEHPTVALLGGAKLETKLPALKTMLSKVDTVLVGGAMIFTFYQANGWETGTSLVDEDYILDAKALLGNGKLILPSDVLVADSRDDDSGDVVAADAIPDDKIGLDIGPETIATFKDHLKKAKTIIWNGPLGYEESPVFAEGTNKIARFLASCTAKTIIGGGDTLTVLDDLGITDAFDHVSTGGGAALMLLEGEQLPALTALE
jgi:3-phosphoglycerate kinase